MARLAGRPRQTSAKRRSEHPAGPTLETFPVCGAWAVLPSYDDHGDGDA